MTTTVKDMLAAANAVVPRVTPQEAQKLMETEGALLVDVRDAPEVEASGKAKARPMSRAA